MDRQENMALDDLCYLQFSKKYAASNIEPKPSDFKSKKVLKSLLDMDALDFIVTHNFKAVEQVSLLPRAIRIINLKPGEPKYMRVRSTRVARMHKFNQVKSPHEFFYSELQLYVPFRKEEELEPESLEKCKLKYEERSDNGLKKVTNVKKILMKHLESVEEGTDKAQQLIDTRIGDTLDAAYAQENVDCDDEGIHEHPDFVATDPEVLPITDVIKRENMYKKIEQ